MIEALHIKGFKSLAEEKLVFKPLTILTGLNSSGKSSVIQAILLLARHCSENPELRKYALRFSKFKEINNKYENSKDIQLSLRTSEMEAALHFSIDSDWEFNSKGNTSCLIYENTLFYLSSNRIGPEELAPYEEDRHFGMDGEYIYSAFERFKDKPIHADLLVVGPQTTLAAQLSHWLEYSLDTSLDLVTERITSTQVKVSFDCDGLKNISPFNLGSGNSYLSKALILGLCCQPNHILIIENPEIHLHPKAQSRMAEFFVFLASRGIQVILESHSEHLLDKVRHQVYTKKLEASATVIHYKAGIRQAFISLNINHCGRYCDDSGVEQDFPSGFFDSTLCELLEII
jgi:predicted ATPase